MWGGGMHWPCGVEVCTGHVGWRYALAVWGGGMHWPCGVEVCTGRVGWRYALAMWGGGMHWPCGVEVCTGHVGWRYALAVWGGGMHWPCGVEVCTGHVGWRYALAVWGGGMHWPCGVEVCTGRVRCLWFKFILLTLPLLDNYLPGSLAFWVVANKRFDFTYIRNKGNKIIIPWIDNGAVTPSNIGCFLISGRRHCYYIQLQTNTEIPRKKMLKFFKRKMKQRNFFINMKQQMFSLIQEHTRT